MSSTLTYVLDTNVLLANPKSIFVFEEHQVVIPLPVLRELDKFKKDNTELGANARTVSRYLDKLRQRGDLRKGVPLEGGGTLRVDLVVVEGSETTDDAIIRSAFRQEGTTTLVTRDTNMRILASCVGVTSEDFRHDRGPEVSDQYTGWREEYVSDEDIDEVRGCLNGGDYHLTRDWNLLPNECVNMIGTHSSQLIRVDGHGRVWEVKSSPASGLTPKSREQSFALSLLMEPTIPLVTLSGVAGTGKTLLALAAGLQQVPGSYQRILVSRPVIPLDKGIGFLPGTLEEKMDPWMSPIWDNLDFLLCSSKKRKREGKPWVELINQGLLEVEALSFIRGRSLPNLYMVIDEAQNLTPHEVKTILTRAGKGTKVILTGDPMQIDNPYVDSRSNGLTYAIEKFKSSSLAAHITLRKGERSDLAEEAARIL